MKPYSLDLRERVVSAIEKGDSFRKVAQRFAVSKTCVERWVKMKRTEGHIVPRKQGGSVSAVMAHKAQLMTIFEQRTDATLAESCELLYDETGLWVSLKYYVPNLPAAKFTPKKSGETPRRRQAQGNARQDKTRRAEFATSERVQLLRAEYWSQVTEIDLKDLVFRMGNGCSTRTHENSCPRFTWRESL